MSCFPCRGKMTGGRRCGRICRNFSTVVTMGRGKEVPWDKDIPALGLSVAGSFSFSRYLLDRKDTGLPVQCCSTSTATIRTPVLQFSVALCPQ